MDTIGYPSPPKPLPPGLANLGWCSHPCRASAHGPPVAWTTAVPSPGFSGLRKHGYNMLLQLRNSLSFFLGHFSLNCFFCHLGHFFGDSSFLVLILDGENVIGLIYGREYLHEKLMVNEKTWFPVCRFSHNPIQ